MLTAVYLLTAVYSLTAVYWLTAVYLLTAVYSLLAVHLLTAIYCAEDCLASSEDLLMGHCDLDNYKLCKVVAPPQAVARNAMALCLQGNLLLSARAAQNAFENATKHTVNKPTLMPCGG